ncbi:MAG TPA: hypothetical protein VK879_14730 [Candidatus Sulfomarinibacteraceae bacterium]|nr:hypothetical protein [Candidatus Sulfomarinibacteraceae bacterium]
MARLPAARAISLIDFVPFCHLLRYTWCKETLTTPGQTAWQEAPATVTYV